MSIIFLIAAGLFLLFGGRFLMGKLDDFLEEQEDRKEQKNMVRYTALRRKVSGRKTGIYFS